MKFVHIADMHFDTSFSQINDSNLGTLRRLDQRKVFKKVIDYIEENSIDCLFIAGDLYEQKYIRESTIEYINTQFKRIKNTQIYITPGNHDPYIQNSYYTRYTWSDNVKIFTSKVEKVELPEFDLYGFGFDDFYMRDSKLNQIQIDNKEKDNILIMHASLDGGSDDERCYNTVSSSKLRQLGFDYVALGHVHKRTTLESGNVFVYPGSTVSLGFDELGAHGMVVGEINNHNVSTEFIPLDESEFVVTDIDVSDLNSIEDLIEHITNLELNINNYYEINLIGNRNFEIDIYNIKKIINNPRIIKVKNSTKIAYNLEKLAGDYNLKGLFVKEMMERLEKAEESEKKIISDALEIGLGILEK